MSVLKGEGKHSMLYGSYRLPVGRDLPAYIARPDVTGSSPTVVVAHGAWGLSSHVKAVCRRLARYGFAAICPDLYRGALTDRLTDADEAAERFGAVDEERVVRDLIEAADNAIASGTEWANGGRIGLLAFGETGTAALRAAASIESAQAAAIVYSELDAETLAGCPVSVLGVYGTEDEVADDVRSVHESTGRGSFAFYGGVGRDFLDEARDGYDFASAEDAFDRIIGFFEAKLALD